MKDKGGFEIKCKKCKKCKSEEVTITVPWIFCRTRLRFECESCGLREEYR